MQDSRIIQIYTIIVPPNAHKCVELGDTQINRYTQLSIYTNFNILLLICW
jgi:ribonuclease HIII